ncbi:hypothetical protein KRIGEM_02014 [Komagataeibacter rhaeticus]|nr:hypothetical protein KRIGEM_02014 [Komagataeibacter rhaeticus]
MKKIVFLGLALLAAVAVSYPTISTAHHVQAGSALFEQK